MSGFTCSVPRKGIGVHAPCIRCVLSICSCNSVSNMSGFTYSVPRKGPSVAKVYLKCLNAPARRGMLSMSTALSVIAQQCPKDRGWLLKGGGERRRQPVFQFEEAAKNNVNDEGGGGACSMHWRAAAAGMQAWQAVMHAYWDRRQLRRRLRSEGRGGGGGRGRKLRNRMRNDRTNERASSGLRASQSANRRRNKFMGSKEGWRCSSSSSRRKERRGKHNCGQKSWVNQYRRQRFLSSAFQLIWRL